MNLFFLLELVICSIFLYPYIGDLTFVYTSMFLIATYVSANIATRKITNHNILFAINVFTTSVTLWIINGLLSTIFHFGLIVTLMPIIFCIGIFAYKIQILQSYPSLQILVTFINKLQEIILELSPYVTSFFSDIYDINKKLCENSITSHYISIVKKVADDLFEVGKQFVIKKVITSMLQPSENIFGSGATKNKRNNIITHFDMIENMGSDIIYKNIPLNYDQNMNYLQKSELDNQLDELDESTDSIEEVTQSQITSSQVTDLSPNVNTEPDAVTKPVSNAKSLPESNLMSKPSRSAAENRAALKKKMADKRAMRFGGRGQYLGGSVSAGSVPPPKISQVELGKLMNLMKDDSKMEKLMKEIPLDTSNGIPNINKADLMNAIKKIE